MRSPLYRGLLTCCLWILLVHADAQDFSNKGKDFWITFPAHVDGTGAVMGIYITSDKAATGQVSFAGTNIPFSIIAGGLQRIFLGPGGNAPNNAVYLALQDGIQANAGIRVTSDNPVVVYAHIIRSARSGATLILPSTVWGKEYIVPSYRSAGQSGANSGYGVINIVAKDPNTLVEITPKVASRSGKPAGTPYTITLSQPGDVYQVQYNKDQDISGTRIRSIAVAGTTCKPIGVFSATTWSAFNCPGASGGDNLLQQLFPTRAFGRNFLTAPFIRKTFDIFRVFVTDPSTVVNTTIGGVTSTLTGLVGGSYYEFTSNQPSQVVADKPISVVQYMTSQSCGNSTPSDPEMVLLNPVEQTINDITVFSAHQNWVPAGQSNVNQCYLNIIIKTSAAGSFRINGAAPNGTFQVIPGTQYSYLQEDVTSRSLTNPVQNLRADSNFSAIAYGYGNVESYGYNAGTNVKDQFQFITIKNDYATVNFPATCINTPFKFAITLPYQPTKLEWKFFGLFPDIVVNNPVSDSSYVVEGRTIYRYTLPASYTMTNTGLYKVKVLATNPTSDGCAGEQEIDYEIEVFGKPKASFVWQHSGCTTDSVRFTDNSNGLGRPVNRWIWDFGDTKTDSIKNPVHKYAVAGNYTVKQSIITDVGCLADSSALVVVTNPPAAKFGFKGPACAGSAVTFSDSSTAPGATLAKWYWDFGNGRKDTVTSNAQRTVIYTAPGTYTVSLVVESQSGCKSSVFTRNVIVTPFPVADFIPPGGICLPSGLAAFSNTSTIADGTQAQFQYLWNFGDNGTSTLKDPVHFYTTAGPFNVKLTVTSGAGCVKDTTKIITEVFAQPKANFTLSAELCLRDSSRFTDQSTALNQQFAKYYWDFGDGRKDSTMNAALVFANPGTYAVKHWGISDKGCRSDTVTKQHVVNPLPTPDFSTNTPVCAGQEVTFTDKSLANAGNLTRWQWDLGDGTQRDLNNNAPFKHTYLQGGNILVTLVVTSSKGCKSDTLKRTVAISSVPVPQFVLPEVCLNDAFAQFTNTTTINDGSDNQISYLWNFGDPNANAGNPNTSTLKNAQHRYTAAGNYNVKLMATSSKGCRDSVTTVLIVNGDKPKADFVVTNPNALCSNVVLELTNKSTVNFGRVTKLEIYWDWPNTTNVSVDEDPDFDKKYNKGYPAFYTPLFKDIDIRVVAYSGGVCVNDIVKTVRLNASPKIQFSPMPGICIESAPRQITQARDLGNLPGSFVYKGKGVSATGMFDPAAAGVGSHIITYIYTSTLGCKDSASQSITVWPRPIAQFSIAPPTCVTQPVTFSDASQANTGTITNWSWNYGNGTAENRANGAPFQVTYPITGAFTATLTVTTDSGCVSQPASQNVRINPLPVVDFSLPVVCLPLGEARFTNNSTIADGSQAQMTYLWNFGLAGATSTLKDPVYNYSDIGPYNVSLEVTSKDGCKQSLTKQLTDINRQPLSNIELLPAEVCLGAQIQMADRSNPLNETVTSYRWNYGNGQGSNQQNTSFTYTSAGTYNVSFYYTTAKGCHSDTIVKQAVVHPFPVVNAGPDQVVLEGGQVMLPATATGSSSYLFNWTPATYLNNPNLLQPVSSPMADIVYTLSVTGTGGCISTDQVSVKLLLAPEIPNAFSPNGDGINDVWNIKYLDSYPGAVIQLFDRYGRQVFLSTGYSRPWDGKNKGIDVPVGVYYYIIDPKNGRKTMTGSVTVIR